jgi:hypothetical protein
MMPEVRPEVSEFLSHHPLGLVLVLTGFFVSTIIFACCWWRVREAFEERDQMVNILMADLDRVRDRPQAESQNAQPVVTQTRRKKKATKLRKKKEETPPKSAWDHILEEDKD